MATANIGAFETIPIPRDSTRHPGTTIFYQRLAEQPNLIGQAVNTNTTIVYTQANAAFNQANAAYAEANGAATLASLAYGQANSAYNQANLAYTAANSAQTEANTVYSVANSAANTVATFANGTIVLANANLNFNNTATINVIASANGTIQSNVSFGVNSAAVLNVLASGNTSNIVITPEANGQYQIDTRVPTGGGGGSPAGSNTWVQFNNTGSFGATINLSFNESGNVLNVWSINVASNIANVGNLAISQNTITGNLIVVSSANVVTLNANGIVSINASPSINNATRPFTGLASYKAPTSISGNATLTVDNSLILTFNEIGHYIFEGYLVFYETTAGTGGFQFDLGANTAISANLAYDVQGFGTAALALVAAITANNTATSVNPISTSSSAPSWLRFKGSCQITTAGYIGVRWAQASALGADLTNLIENSYFIATKVG